MDNHIASNKIGIISIAIIFLIISISFSFVFASHNVSTFSAGTAFYINEDLTNLFNISINNTDAGQTANITQVNITLWSNLVYNTGTNGTNASFDDAAFRNLSTILVWNNATGYLINGSERQYFWFNATAAIPGAYNITITTLNATHNLSTNLSVYVNDTTAPNVTINIPSRTNYSATSMNFNVSAADSYGKVKSCWITLNTGVANSTMNNVTLSQWNYTNSTIGQGTYTARFYCADDSNETGFAVVEGVVNTTESYIFTLDTRAPNISYLSGTPGNGVNQTFNKLFINVSIADANQETITYTVFNTTGLYNRTFYSLTGNTTLNLTLAANDIYSYNVTINDSAGNVNYTDTRTITFDNIAPNVTVVFPVNNTDRQLGVSVVNFELMVMDNVQRNGCWYTLNIGKNNMTMNASGSNYSATNSSIADGAYRVYFYCNDSAGNINNSYDVQFDINSTRWRFAGYTYNVNGTALNGTNITFAVKDSSRNSLYNTSTISNASGYFSINLMGNATNAYMYQMTLIHTNITHNFVDWVGQSLPSFPYAEFSRISGSKYYLKEAGTINITVMNRSSNLTSFMYQVKDTKLGYPVSGCTSNDGSNETICYVPKDRNYSIMVYPSQAGSGGQFVPVSFEWKNFSVTTSYNITDGIGATYSHYNATKRVLEKNFNITESFASITGYANMTSFVENWTDFTVIPFLTESGNMIFMQYGTLPYNLSAWNSGQSDFHNLTNGFYNITVPYAPAETVKYIFFAATKKGNIYYGGYRNITVSGNTGANFSMYGLIGANGSFNMSQSTGSGRFLVNTTRRTFNLVNASSNATLSNVNAHIETVVDYTNYNCTEFTFVEETSQSGAANFSFPLLNVTGIKEINIYSQTFSPKRVGTKSASQILANANISMSSFNPGDIDGRDLSDSVYVTLYYSNSSCDVPNPGAGCIAANSANMDTFNPLSAVISGGALSFRMGLTSSGIEIQYVNVDLLASGPPDGLFDDSTTNSTSGGFSSIMRFGSQGPTIYNYVLVSMPYTEGNSTQTGLNETNDINFTIADLYDEDWNVIWNSTLNGTSGSDLGTNLSHYSTHSSDWQILIRQNNCTRAVGSFNATYPCYIDTTNNKLWIRLPHFSGTNAVSSGSVRTADGTGSTSTSSGGGASSSFWSKTTIVTEQEFKDGYSSELARKQRVRLKIDSKYHYVGLTGVTTSTATINVSSDPQQATLNIGDTRKFDVTGDKFYDLSVTLEGILNNKASITIKSIYEKITEESQAVEQQKEEGALEQKGQDLTGQKPVEQPAEKKGEKFSWWIWILVIIIVLVVAAIIWSLVKRRGVYSKSDLKKKVKFFSA